MPNVIFRNKVKQNIINALTEANDASNVDHPSLKGQIREIAIRQLFTPLLIEGLCIGTGKIVDNVGNQSQQCDAVIYSKKILPSIFYGELGIFPIETCAVTIEIKSKLSSTEVLDAVTKARKLNSLDFSSGYYLRDIALQHEITKVVPTVFAFSSDLKGAGKTEIERYLEIDNPSSGIPNILGLCVVGKGFWNWKEINKQWVFRGPSEEYDEVIEFLSAIINAIPNILSSRRAPRIGAYIVKNDR